MSKAHELEAQIEDDLVRWGGWARSSSLSALSWPRRCPLHEKIDRAVVDDPHAELVEVAVLKLDRHHRKIVKLRYVYRWPCHQLGRAVKRSRRSVYRDLREARIQVARYLYGEMAELGLRLAL